MARNLCNILLLALCFGSFASARLSEGGRVLQDNGSITDNIKDFFTDDRCLRTEKDLTNLLDLSNWMSSIENADSLRLMDMTIPGSHNSNSYDLTTDLNINDPEYTEVKDATFGLSEDIVSQWICDYALTQSLSLSEQLQAGIRYLDLRIDYDAANLQFRASHMLYGLNAEDLLNQIANFATGHPKEIVFVEFGPIYAGIPAETKQEFQRIITNAFAGVLIPTSTDLSTVTLGQLQNGTANVFVIVSDDVVGNSTLIWHDQDVLENTYSNTDDVETMVAFNKARIDDFKAQNNTDTFYKIQWILTPTANYIRMNPLVGSLYVLAKEANARLSDLSGSSSKLFGNVLIVDYIETSRLMKLLDLEKYSSGAFVPEAVDPQSKWTGAAKAGLALGVIACMCGLFCLRKWCRNKKN